MFLVQFLLNGLVIPAHSRLFFFDIFLFSLSSVILPLAYPIVACALSLSNYNYSYFYLGTVS